MGEEVKLPTYETLLTEAIRNLAVDSGVVSSPIVTANNTLTDSSKDWASGVHKNRLVKIVRGTGAGQIAVIDNNSRNTLIIRGGWLRGIAAGAVYVILEKDLAQILRDVLGGGSDISAANPLETHDPKVEAVEDKLDDPAHGLAALKALIDSLAGGAFYGSYGPKNVEVGNDVDFGIILYDPSGNIITVGEITLGTYTVHRVRGAVDTEIVAATPSSEAAGRVYMTYNFPAANWAVGDIFYITFSGIIVTIDGVTTEYPNLYIWGRVVREAAISDKIGTNVDATGTTTLFARLRQIVDTYLADATIGLAVIEGYVDILDDATNGLANIKSLIDTLTTYVDTEVAAILAAVDTEVADIKAVTDALPDAGALTTLITHLTDIKGAGWTDENLTTIDSLIDTLLTRVTAAVALASVCTEARLAELDSTNIPADTDPKVMGRAQIFEKSITSAANAGDVNVATITDQPCLIESVVIHADTAQPAHMTSCGVFGGTNKVVTFISATDAVRDNLDAADKQVAWTGAVRLAAAKTIVIPLVGTGTDPVDLTIVIKYRACVSGGYLALFT